MKRFKKTIAIFSAIVLTLSVLDGSLAVSAEDVVYNGNTVIFDAAGNFTDELANFDHVYEHVNVVAATGSALNAGDVSRIKKSDDALEDGYIVYNAGDGGSFNSISVDVGGFNKWDLNYDTEHLAVYTGVVSASDSSIVCETKLELDREIAVDKISHQDTGALSYTARQIPEGTKYLVVKLTDTAFEILRVKLEKVDTDSFQYTQYYKDDLVSAKDGEPIPDTDIHKNIKSIKVTEDWECGPYYGDDTVIRSLAEGMSTENTSTLTYQMDFNIKYLYISTFSYYQDKFKDNIIIKTSTDGVTYTKLNIVPEYPATFLTEGSAGSYPNIYRTNILPRNTRFVKVEFDYYWWEPVLGEVVLKGVLPSEDEVTVVATDHLDNFNNIYQVSDNLRFDQWTPVDYPDQFAGDQSRIRRTKNEDAFVVYRTTSDIKTIELQAHGWFSVPNVYLYDDIKAFVSSDGVDFSKEIPLTRDPSTAPSEGENRTYRYSNASTIPDGYKYIKFTLTGNVWDGGALQLGYVKLGGYAPFEFDPISQGVAIDNFEAGLNTVKSYSNNLEVTSKAVDGYDFGGDTARIKRVADNTSDISITYSTTTEIRSISAEVYNYYKASEGYKPNDPIVAVSKDDVGYIQSGITLQKNTTPDPEGGWQKITYRASNLPSGSRYISMTLVDSSKISPQIGKVTLSGINVGDKQFNIIPGIVEIERPATTTIKNTALPITIDGIVETDEAGLPIGEWESAGLADVKGITDTNGYVHSAKVFLKYDYDNLYIGAKIKDPTPMINNNTGNNLWNGDNLEIFLGTEDLNYIEQPGKKDSMILSDVQIVLSGGIVNGKTQYYLATNGEFTYPTFFVEVKPDADGKGYTIEAAIPLELLGVENAWEEKQMIFNAVLNDGAVSGRGQWGWTTNDEASKKRRGLWGLAKFERTAAPSEQILVNAAYNRTTQMVTISGNTVDVKGKEVTLLVKDSSGKIIYVDQTLSSVKDGSYKFDYKINTRLSTDNNYTVTVGGEDILRTNQTTYVLKQN